MKFGGRVDLGNGWSQFEDKVDMIDQKSRNGVVETIDGYRIG